VTPVVVDASVAGAWLLPDETSRRADRILTSIRREGATMSVLSLWIYEIANLLLSAERRGRLDDVDRADALRLIESLPRQVHDHESPIAQRRLAELAARFRLSAYDAAYLELADRLQGRLYTFDDRLARAADALGCA